MSDALQVAIVGLFSGIIVHLLGELRIRSSAAKKQRVESQAQHAADYQSFLQQVSEELETERRLRHEAESERDCERALRRSVEDELAALRRKH